MSCTPARPCGPLPRGLEIVPPPPGLSYLTRRIGRFGSFLDDLVAATEQQRQPDGRLLGDGWDIEGDPRARLVAELWALVADGVSTYTELTASEAYLGTAHDWTDLRRLAGLVGYRPRPGVAATGWVQVETDKGANPIIPAGTRVQAPAAPPARPRAQSFEVIATTQLQADWAGLTATWVPQPKVPTGRDVRFLGDPGFNAGDRVLLVSEVQPPPPGIYWYDFWYWLVFTLFNPPVSSGSTALAVAKVVSRKAELGTTVITFDRDMAKILSQPDVPYAAYRVKATAGSARRLTKVLKFASDPTPFPLPIGGSTPKYYETDSAIDASSVTLDAAIDDLSTQQLVAIVDWRTGAAGCDIVPVDSHTPVHWETAPGAPTRVSRLGFNPTVPTLTNAATNKSPVTVYVLDRREVARHYVFPDKPPAQAPQSLRLYPAPADDPPLVRVAVDVGAGRGDPVWQLVEVSRSAHQELASLDNPSAPVGLTVDFTGPPPPIAQPLAGTRASANLVKVHHGATSQAVLGSGDALQSGQRFTGADAPIAYDLDESADVVPTMVLRVDGVSWAEVPTLYAAGPAADYVADLNVDGGVTTVFGDGDQGLRLPTGRNNVTATYRVGGGSEGEVETGDITALVGSVRGVKKVRGAGPTSGGADQDDERRLRSLVPARARAFGRVVSQDDLADLALAFPGVTHAAAWRGAGPPGCPCGGIGLHVAILRRSISGAPRAPLTAEVDSLSTYLDGRRDATIPLCVCAGTATTLTLAATLVVDPRRVATQVAAAAVAALVDPTGPLDPSARRQGQAVDRSDILAVIQPVAGVVGVLDLAIGGATIPPGSGDQALGRQPAERWELLMVPSDPSLTTGAP